MEKRLTKKDLFGMLLEVLQEADLEQEESDMLVEFINHEIELVEKKNSNKKQKEKSEDVLKELVYSKLDSSEFKTTQVILSEISDFEGVSSAKVSARLTALVNDGLVVKEQVKQGNRKLMGYKIP